MECALWLNRHKIYSADEIAGDPDIVNLRGYFLGGSLVEWLNEHGGAHYAEKLEKLDRDDPELNEKLAAIFSGSPEGGKRFGESAPERIPQDADGSFAFGAVRGSSVFPVSYGSLVRLRSENGSFRFGSGMHEWEWEWLFRKYRGSFGSAGYGSFGRYLNLLKYGSFGSFFLGSFWSMGNFGSFSALEIFAPDELNAPNALEGLDEYDRIMYETLMMCPLDRFGYGIHNI